MSAMLPAPGAVTDGSKSQMNGSSSTPTKAVNRSITATLLCLKNRSTRYLSKWTEMAHSTGPENAKTTQDTRPPVTALRGPCRALTLRSARAARALMPPPEQAQFCLSGQ